MSAPDESTVSLLEAIIALVACLTLTVTAFFAALAVRFSRDAVASKREVEDLKSTVGRYREHAFGIRASAATIAKMLSDSYAVLDVMRRALENAMEKVWEGDTERAASFAESVAAPLERLSRIEEYLKLLNPRSRENFQESVSIYVEKFPDQDTVDELRDISGLLPEPEAKIAQDAAENLRQRLRRFDSFAWTGSHH